ncbi:MAG: tRNA (adenosine(37)-N6)-dimethylallyltransferase MiaA [Mariprofundaceae bacterium]|nr:tRNA (adenosine(37)-N6)-dimethylallyltransferase MiaA [Mariprofundaceae bacterium]
MLKAMALVGATGTGKSALAQSWAEQTGNCIITCDSMQVYKGLNIGTAKATQAEQTRARHVLLDCVDLPHVYSTADWARAARDCIASENIAGRTPLICGGTGFYLRTLLSGIADIPSVDAAIRKHFNERLETEGHAAMHAILQKVDATTAARLAKGDGQRVLRALTVFEATGIALSVWQQKENLLPPIHCTLLWLQKPRIQLRDDLAVRFHQMMDMGWLDEVSMLKNSACDGKHPSKRAVGYRQCLDYLAGTCDKATAIADGITATRRYAKRQETWFRHQLDADIIGDTAVIGDYLLSHTIPKH